MGSTLLYLLDWYMLLCCRWHLALAPTLWPSASLNGTDAGWSLKEFLDRAVDEDIKGLHPESPETAHQDSASHQISDPMVCISGNSTVTDSLETPNALRTVDQSAQDPPTGEVSKPESEPPQTGLSASEAPPPRTSGTGAPLLVCGGPSIQPAIPESLSHLHSNLAWSSRKIQNAGMEDNGPGKTGMSPRELRRKDLTRY